MLSISRSSVLAITAIGLLIAAASVCRAKDEQDQNAQQQQQEQQQQQQAQPGQPGTIQSAVQADEQNQKNNQPNQANEQQNQSSRQDSDNNSRAAKQSADQQPSDQVESTRSAPGAREWPSPQRYNDNSDPSSSSRRTNRDWGENRSMRSDNIRNSQRNTETTRERSSESRDQQGATLGVNITSSDQGRGIIVQRVHPNTPADEMGIRTRDRITLLNGEPVRSVDEFISTIRNMEPGAEVELQITRDGNDRTVRGELAALGETIARGDLPGLSDDFRRYQDVISRPGPGQFGRDETIQTRAPWSPGQRPNDLELNSSRENRQTSYEERTTQSNRSRSGDLESRVSRIEQQLDRLIQDIDDLRSTIGTRQMGISPGLRDSGTDFRTGAQNPPAAANAAQPRPSQQQRMDRWNTNENRFQSGDLRAARERAAQEAARRRAEQTGAQLQQQQNALRGPQPNAPVPNSPQQGQLPPNPQAQP